MSKLKLTIQFAACVILMFVLVHLNNSFCFLSIPTQNELQEISYNLFTVNATMGGFAFTVLGMLYSFSSKEYVKAMQGTNIIVNKASTIMQTIIFAGASGFVNLFLIIFKYKDWFHYVFILSLLLLIFCFAYFIKSMNCIYSLIKNIHEFDQHENNSRTYQRELNSGPNKDTW